MNVSLFIEKNMRLQKQSLNNLIDTVTTLQCHTERTCRYWNYKIGVDKNVQTAADHFWATMKNGQRDAIMLVNTCFACVEACFPGFD